MLFASYFFVHLLSFCFSFFPSFFHYLINLFTFIPCLCVCVSDVTMGFTSSNYTAEEGDSSVEICVAVFSGILETEVTVVVLPMRDTAVGLSGATAHVCNSFITLRYLCTITLQCLEIDNISALSITK